MGKPIFEELEIFLMEEFGEYSIKKSLALHQAIASNMHVPLSLDLDGWPSGVFRMANGQ